MTRLFVMLCVSLACAACKKDDAKANEAPRSSGAPAAAATSASAAQALPKACDDYATKMTVCFAKMTEDERAQNEPGFEATRDAWREQKDMATLAKDCKLLIETLPAQCK